MYAFFFHFYFLVFNFFRTRSLPLAVLTLQRQEAKIMKLFINLNYDNYVTEGPDLVESDRSQISNYLFGKSVVSVGGTEKQISLLWVLPTGRS